MYYTFHYYYSESAAIAVVSSISVCVFYLVTSNLEKIIGDCWCLTQERSFLNCQLQLADSKSPSLPVAPRQPQMSGLEGKSHQVVYCPLKIQQVYNKYITNTGPKTLYNANDEFRKQRQH